MIRRLVESCELFLEVNQMMIHKEKMKRGIKNGSWRSTKELREVTMIMDRLIWFTKNLRIQPINKDKASETNFYEHFITLEITARSERDTIKKTAKH